MITIRRALFSVSDKTGLVELAQALIKHRVQILASGGTASALRKADVPVTLVEDWTGSPEAMEGRIKTLHPRIHGGILARRDHAGDQADLARLGLEPIDLVVVNFYPFRETLHAGKSEAEIVESIDVGGPSMVRAAAKNSSHVVVLTEPDQYENFLGELEQQGGQVSEEFAKACAARAFANLVAYDSIIAGWLNEDRFIGLPIERVRPLRYGENPHQAGWLCAEWNRPHSGLVAADQLAGKGLSYNNFLDASGALRLLAEFTEPTAVIIKHATPCGVGTAPRLPDALEAALETDRVSAFGGIIALNREMDGDTARVVGDMFLEVILAPAFSDSAREVFAKKKALRLLTFSWDELIASPPEMEVRPVWGGYLMQEADTGFPELDDLKVVTRRAPSVNELVSLKLGWRVCKHVRSNAIVFADGRHTLGIGAGQMSRVDSVELAIRKAAAAKLDLKDSACASDAFFPFRDGLDAAARAGATAVIQPGGSVRDDEVIAAANEHNMTMVFTGRRHFRH